MWACPNLFISRPQRVPDKKVHVRDTCTLAHLILPIFLGHQCLLLHRPSPLLHRFPLRLRGVDYIIFSPQHLSPDIEQLPL